MRRFFCHCGQEVFFENNHCNRCGSQLGFNPLDLTLNSLLLDGDIWRSQNEPEKEFHVCEHWDHPMRCNWLLPVNDTNQQCISCRLTRMIPAQTINRNVRRWGVLESAKRRTLYGLLQLNIPFLLPEPVGKNALIFDFLEDQRSNTDVIEEQIYSGHSQGVITMNVAEADDSYREATKEAMNEPYRTLLGHFRHEVGHYYWDQLILNSDYYETFRQLFGDETLDYRATLDAYYINGPIKSWQESFISAYASAHPLEDWAETWAHYMLMSETLETAQAFNLVQMDFSSHDFNIWLQEWMQLGIVLNALNRSTGNSDAYPFVISAPAREKLGFVHQLIYAVTSSC